MRSMSEIDHLIPLDEDDPKRAHLCELFRKSSWLCFDNGLSDKPLKEALRLADQFESECDDWMEAAALSLKATCLFKLRDVKGAAKVYKRALACKTDDPRVLPA